MFKYIEDTLKDSKPSDRWFIVCANINIDDTWLWKYCVHEDNFTPVFSNEYGDCSISTENLSKSMNSAEGWINGFKKLNNDIKPHILYLMKASVLD